MSPYSYYVESNSARVFVAGSWYGRLSYANVTDNHIIRPVISLKSSVVVTGGDGSGTNPYTVEMP
ncbi:MAG: hypothetical protein HFE04_00435 [Bacilli bacterium]|nr:hypothetical protein [Bacilli bacterium]